MTDKLLKIWQVDTFRYLIFGILTMEVIVAAYQVAECGDGGYGRQYYRVFHCGTICLLDQQHFCIPCAPFWEKFHRVYGDAHWDFGY